MWEYLDKLKQKPKAVRQQIALATTIALSSLVFFVWWTTFTASESESVISVGEALSPIAALTEMASVGVDSFGEFTRDLKSHVLQVQYEASSTDPSMNLGAAAEGSDVLFGGTDIVYPDEVFGTRISKETAFESRAQSE